MVNPQSRTNFLGLKDSSAAICTPMTPIIYGTNRSMKGFTLLGDIQLSFVFFFFFFFFFFGSF